jgi:uncharacterized protein (TIRG00374 family)
VRTTESEKDNLTQDPNDEQVQMPKDIGSSLFTPRTVISFLFALVVLFFVFRRTNLDFGESLRQMRNANLWYLAGAMGAYYITFVLRGWRWKEMLASAGISDETGHKMPNLVGMFQIMTLSWFTNSILPARMGDAYRCYLIKRRSGASFGISLGTMLAERLIDLVVLVAILLLSSAAVYGTHAPDRAQQAFLIGGGVVVIGVVGVVVLWFLRERIEVLMPTRILRVYQRVRKGLFESLAKPALPLGVSVILWLFDGLRVWFVASALGEVIPYEAAIMVALLSALVSTVPITPAGLGFVEGIMIYALTTIGVGSSTAGAIALLDRVVTYGSLIIVGGLVYLWVLRTDLRVDHARSG